MIGIAGKAFARVILPRLKILTERVYHMVATLSGKSGKTKKNDKSPEKSGENGGFRKKVMKSQEI